jgi:hypothetical protein
MGPHADADAVRLAHTDCVFQCFSPGCYPGLTLPAQHPLDFFGRLQPPEPKARSAMETTVGMATYSAPLARHPLLTPARPQRRDQLPPPLAHAAAGRDASCTITTRGLPSTALP